MRALGSVREQGSGRGWAEWVCRCCCCRCAAHHRGRPGPLQPASALWSPPSLPAPDRLLVHQTGIIAWRAVRTRILELPSSQPVQPDASYPGRAGAGCPRVERISMNTNECNCVPSSILATHGLPCHRFASQEILEELAARNAMSSKVRPRPSPTVSPCVCACPPPAPPAPCTCVVFAACLTAAKCVMHPLGR